MILLDPTDNYDLLALTPKPNDKNLVDNLRQTHIYISNPLEAIRDLMKLLQDAEIQLDISMRRHYCNAILTK